MMIMIMIMMVMPRVIAIAIEKHTKQASAAVANFIRPNFLLGG